MRKNTKIIGFSVPVTVAEEVDEIARRERRTKSEVFQAMLRLYQKESSRRGDDFDEWVQGIIEDTLEEKTTNPIISRKGLATFRRQAQQGNVRANDDGLDPDDEEKIDRIVHEERQARKQQKRS